MNVLHIDGPGGSWRVLVPETRRERMRGLRGRPTPGPREAMWFRLCRSVHTFGMSAPISVAFLDRAMRVIEVRPAPPRRVVVARRHGVRHALECSDGTELRVGDRFRTRARAGR